MEDSLQGDTQGWGHQHVFNKGYNTVMIMMTT